MKSVTKHTVALFALCFLALSATAQSPALNTAPVSSGGQGSAGTDRPPALASVVPGLIRFSGAVTGVQGKPLSGLTFAIYQDQTSGAPLWLETQSVSLDANGRYTIFLGANHPAGVPADIFASGEARWLGVQPEGQPEQPRVLLVSVPYAMKAADADTLGGLPASSYVTADQLNQSAVGSRQLAVPAAGYGEPALDSRGPVTPGPCTSMTSDGAALANFLTRFTTPCNLENSGLYQSALATTPGFIGIGTTAPQAPLDLQPAAQTGATGDLYGEHIVANFNPSANSTANYYAFYGQSNSSTGNATNFMGDIVGSGFIAQHYGTGTAANVFGANYTTQNRSTGTITNAVGFFAEVGNLGSGTITNGYGLWVPVPQNSGGGVFTNFYGVYISNPTGISNSWGLYSLANTNYMSGKLGIGVMAPTQALEINGNLKLDTIGHGITYPDGSVQTTATIPGGGTITGVTAGTDLTGGGTSGKVTVNLDTTKVPTLAAASNTFSGGITAASLSGNGGLVSNVNAVGLGGIAASGYPQLATPNLFTATQSISAVQPFKGVLQVSNTSASSGSAVYATAAGANVAGVYGEADNGAAAAGVEGASSSGYGVYGTTSSSAPNSTGVYGRATNSSGSSPTYGVYGTTATGDFGEMGSAAVAGTFSSISSTGGTYGYNAGVWGDCNSGGCYGILATADDAFALVAVNDTTANDTITPALYAVNLSSTSRSPVFVASGTLSLPNNDGCLIDNGGNLSCSGTINPTVPAVAGRQVKLYDVASTENWFEDFGSGQLSGGSAKISLDPTFASTVAAGETYHVFLTPLGDCEGLYLAATTASGFEVRELHHGASNIEFDYRIVARRRGYESVRMEDVTEQMNKLWARQAKMFTKRTAGPRSAPPRPPEPEQASRVPQKIQPARTEERNH